DPVDPPVDPVTPPVDPSDETHVNRPEAGSYLANIAAANTLFNTRLHDRLGETQYVDALTGEKKVTSLWLRQVGSHNNWRDGSGQLKTQSNSYVAQLGGDVAQWSTDGLNRGHLGLMAGYGNNHSSTRSSVTGYDSKGSINGYSVGAYGTWFASDADKAGLYVDSWLQYSWFNNQVNGQQLASESYKSKGFTASLETGYTQKLGEFAGSKGTLNEWFIQPQAQATWMGVKADNHREANGTRVSSGGDGNVQTRLGLRTYLKSHHAMDDNKDRTFEPFIEANWLHNTRSYNVNMDNVHINQAGARNIGEVKVGVEGQINPRVNLWGNVGAQ
ncbi:autotransporter outer membrane beta-barrel domain-containing protein, partial [Citrobacter murliniae]